MREPMTALDNGNTLYETMISIFQFVGYFDQSNRRINCVQNSIVYDENVKHLANKQIFLKEMDIEKFVEYFENSVFLSLTRALYSSDREQSLICRSKQGKVYRILIKECIQNNNSQLQSDNLECRKVLVLVKEESYSMDRIDEKTELMKMGHKILIGLFSFIGARDSLCTTYENIYDGHNQLSLPEICQYEIFKEHIDQLLFPEDKSEYIQKLRKCEKSNVSMATFRMYDGDGNVHYFQGMTCQQIVQNEKKYYLMVKNIDSQIQKRTKNKDKKALLLQNASCIQDIIVCIRVKSLNCNILFRDKMFEKDIIDMSWQQVREHVLKAVDDCDYKDINKILDIDFLKSYFRSHNFLEKVFKCKREDGKEQYYRIGIKPYSRGKCKMYELYFSFTDVTEVIICKRKQEQDQEQYCLLIENQNSNLRTLIQNQKHKEKYIDDLFGGMQSHTEIFELAVRDVIKVMKDMPQNVIAENVEQISSRLSNYLRRVSVLPRFSEFQASCTWFSLYKLMKDATDVMRHAYHCFGMELLFDQEMTKHDFVYTDSFALEQTIFYLMRVCLERGSNTECIRIRVHEEETVHEGQYDYWFITEVMSNNNEEHRIEDFSNKGKGDNSLAFLKKYVKGFGGKLQMNSYPGCGNRRTLILTFYGKTV